MQSATLAGVEHEYQLDPARGPLDFRRLIHSLDIDGKRLDPGDVDAYRLRSGAVLTADGVTAEVATPPVPVTQDFADALIASKQTGLQELIRVLPDGTPVFGYSTHLSVSVPDDVNDELCALYARTFGPALMLLMNSLGTEGIYIRPRPGRIEFCGNYLSDDRLRVAAEFVVGSVAALLAHLEGPGATLGAMPGEIEVDVGSDPVRFGLYLSSNSFAAGRSTKDEDRIVGTATGTVRLGELLERSWRTVQPFLSEGVDAIRPVVGRRDESRRGSTSGSSWNRRSDIESASGGQRTALLERTSLAVYGAVADEVTRPCFTVSPAVAVWDFTIFRLASDARTAYVCVPRALLSGFWVELAAGERDADLDSFLRSETKGRVLERNTQTQAFGLWDDLVIGQRLLAPERLPVRPPPRPGLGSRLRATLSSAARPRNEIAATTEPGSGSAPTGGSAGPSATSLASSSDTSARPGKLPPPVGEDREPRPGKAPSDSERGRPGKLVLPLPSTGIHLPSFGSPLLIAAFAALAIVSLGWVGFGLLRGSDAGVEDEPGAAGGVSGGAAGTEVAVARPVVGPIVAVLIPPVTTYSIEAGSRAGLELTYRWSLEADPGEDCGTITPSDHDDPTAGLTSVAWSHANEAPDGCRHGRAGPSIHRAG